MKKKMPDFSKCQDPEFARIMWEASQLAKQTAKNNPLNKVSKEEELEYRIDSGNPNYGSWWPK